MIDQNITQIGLEEQQNISGGSWYDLGLGVIGAAAFAAAVLAAPELLVVAAVVGGVTIL